MKKKTLSIRLTTHTTPRIISASYIREFNTVESRTSGPIGEYPATAHGIQGLHSDIKAYVDRFLEDAEVNE